MSTKPGAAVKQRVLIAILNLNPATMAYRVFKDFIECSNYYDGEMETIHNGYKLAPTIKITFDYEEKHQAQVLEAIDLAQEVLRVGNLRALLDAQPHHKYWAYDTMFDEAMDYIYELLPYNFLRYSSEMVNNRVYTGFKNWFLNLPLPTELDTLADRCVNKYMDLLLRYVNTEKNEEANWKPDFQ